MTAGRSKRKPGLRLTVNANSDVHIDCPDGSRLEIRNEGKHAAQLRFKCPERYKIHRSEIAKVTDAKWQEMQAAYFDQNNTNEGE